MESLEVLRKTIESFVVKLLRSIGNNSFVWGLGINFVYASWGLLLECTSFSILYY